MPLPTPILDDRSYQQLRDELVRRIPVYNPEWTDHNASDPGITLIELFAFLGENLLYRFNQIPETTKLAFLRLLDAPLRPATAAEAMITLTDSASGAPAAAAGNSPPQAPTLVQRGTTAKAGAIPFELGTEVTVVPFQAVVIARSRVEDPTTAEGTDYALAALAARGGLAPGEEAVFYENTRIPSDPSRPDAQPVDFGATVDGMIWIAALGDQGSLADLAGRSINVGFIPDETVSSLAGASEPCPGADGLTPRRDPCAPADASGADGATPEVVWEISTGQLDGKGE